MERLIIHPKGKAHHYNNVVVVVVGGGGGGGGPVLVPRGCRRFHVFFGGGGIFRKPWALSPLFFFCFGLLGNMRLAFNKFQPLGGGGELVVESK